MVLALHPPYPVSALHDLEVTIISYLIKYINNYPRLCTLFSPEVRMAYLKSIAPNLSLRTCQYLKTVLGFGDWLILAMMSQHLDIKLFSDILQEIKNVSFMHKRSISTTIDIIHASDTDGEMEEKDQMKATPIITPMLLRKPSNLALKKVRDEGSCLTGLIISRAPQQLTW